MTFLINISIKVIRQAGQIAKDKFDHFVELRMKDEFGDVVTEVDHMAEEIIIRQIRAAFPSHQIHSEEAGIIGSEGDWLWLIDPLDGTNNFTIGLPVFAVSITLTYRREPVLGVVYEPITERLFVSVISNPFTGMKQEPYLIACHPNHKVEMIRLVRDGLI